MHDSKASSTQNDRTGRASANHGTRSGMAFPAPAASGAAQLAGDEAALHEVEVRDLSDDDARKHVLHNFKKGKTDKPLVDPSGNLVQRKPTKESAVGGEVFAVVKADLNTGTGTTSGTRAYVNDASTRKPNSVKFDYASANSTVKAKTTVTGRNDALAAKNPEADYAYKSGSLWDAGHKLGRQNGGLGNDNDWVFPQNPAFNQGNSRNMDDVEETRPIWRAHEDAFHAGVKADGAGAWWIGFT